MDTDTIQSTRERNNQRIAFHQTLKWLSKHLLKMSKEATAGAGNETGYGDAASNELFLQKTAVRFNAANAETRFEVDHSIMGKLDTTGATPFGRGKVKKSIEENLNYDQYKERIGSCVGCPCKGNQK